MLSELFSDGREIVWKWFNHAMEDKSKNAHENALFFTINWVLPATLITIISLWTISGLFGGVFSTTTNAAVSLGMGGLGYCQHVSDDKAFWTKCSR